jgi:hypothetical protein
MNYRELQYSLLVNLAVMDAGLSVFESIFTNACQPSDYFVTHY